MKRIFYFFTFLLCVQSISAADLAIFNTASIGIKDFLVCGQSIMQNSDSIRNEIMEHKQIVLSHNQNDFTIMWVDSDTSPIDRYQFKYKLEGFDENWYDTKYDRKTRYTNLDAGRYNFRIVYAIDGFWNEEGDSLKIIILPPWWKTLWFKLLVVIIIVTVIYGYTANIIRKRTQSATSKV